MSMRAIVRAYAPWFALGPNGARFLEPIGRSFDRVLQAAVDAVRLRYPSVCPDDALSIIGRDRRLPRAPGESREAYVRRLLLWLDYWALAGLPLGLLYAIQSYVFPGYPSVSTIDRGGRWFTLDAGTSATLTPYEAATLPCAPPPGFAAATSRYVPIQTMPRPPFWFRQANPNNWDYDSNTHPERSESWQDYWIIIRQPSYELQTTYESELTYDSSTCWGLDVNPGTMSVLRELVRLFSSAHAECRGILIAPSATDFDPYALIGDPGFPDGWWGDDVRLVGGAWVATRREDVRYVEV